jgi:hypothetical protein
MGGTYIKILFIVCPKFKLNWLSCILPGHYLGSALAVLVTTSPSPLPSRKNLQDSSLASNLGVVS